MYFLFAKCKMTSVCIAGGELVDRDRGERGARGGVAPAGVPRARLAPAVGPPRHRRRLARQVVSIYTHYIQTFHIST